MRKSIVALLLALITVSTATAEITTHWWGLIAFRQRHEVTKKYTASGSDRGILEFTTDNSTTRLGYQFGVKIDVADNLKVGVTIRSGLTGSAMVMLQEITGPNPSTLQAGLNPGIQEAYIDWTTPYFRAELGKIPQAGTAMWDVYAASLQVDTRLDDPRDGVFNDRVAALNGVRLSRIVGPVTLRGLFHTDYVGGFYTKNEFGSRDFDRTLDRNVVVIGTTVDVGQAFGRKNCCAAGGDSSGCCKAGATGGDMPKSSFLGHLAGLATNGVMLDFDYAFPNRTAKTGYNVDSLRADETIWGATLKKATQMGTFQVGYGYNWRDSVFTMKYWDVLAQANLGNMGRCHGWDLGDLSLSARYQHATEEMEFDPYKGSTGKRDAIHLYLDKTLWGLDVQPRVILFTYKIDQYKVQTLTRYEVTGTVKF